MPFPVVVPPNLCLDLPFKNTPGLADAGPAVALHGGLMVGGMCSASCRWAAHRPCGVTGDEQPGSPWTDGEDGCASRYSRETSPQTLAKMPLKRIIKAAG